jgi:DNA-binding transcriptional LysR family regulator
MARTTHAEATIAAKPASDSDAAGPSARQIEVFRMLMRVGTTGAAAAALHVSQPAVTQLIAQLEARAGLRLFDRQKGRLSPTPEALALMEEVERVYDGLDAVRRKIAALRTHEDTVLRVGSLHAMASSVMPWAVAQFQRSYPRTRCVLTVDSSSGLREALFRGAVDFAFLADEADISGLSSSLFYEVQAACVMQATHPLARRAKVSPVDLRDTPLVALSETDPAQRRVAAALEAVGITPHNIVETPYSATQCALVLAGTGLAITNPLVAREYVPLGLRCVPFDAPVVFRALLAFKPQRAQSRAAQEFIAICRAVLAQHAPTQAHR